MTSTITETESHCVEEVFQRVAGDLSMIADRELEILEVSMDILDHRAAGADSIHISFRLTFEMDSGTYHGCLLVPLAEAVTLAGSLMMLGDDMIEANRASDSIDDSIKDAVLEVGNFVGGATDAAFRALDLTARINFNGCQGVRADVRPALTYTEGQEMITGRAKVAVAGFGEAEILLLLPRAGCQ